MTSSLSRGAHPRMRRAFSLLDFGQFQTEINAVVGK